MDFRMLEGESACLCLFCGTNLHPIDYLMANYGCSFNESIVIIAAFLGYPFPLPIISPPSATPPKQTEETILEGKEKEVFYKNWRYSNYLGKYINLDYFESFKVGGTAAVEGLTPTGDIYLIKLFNTPEAAQKWLDEWMKGARSKSKAN
jgi:hypothetical protein